MTISAKSVRAAARQGVTYTPTRDADTWKISYQEAGEKSYSPLGAVETVEIQAESKEGALAIFKRKNPNVTLRGVVRKD